MRGSSYFRAVLCKHHHDKARIEDASLCTAPCGQDTHLGDVFCPVKTSDTDIVSEVWLQGLPAGVLPLDIWHTGLAHLAARHVPTQSLPLPPHTDLHCLQAHIWRAPAAWHNLALRQGEREKPRGGSVWSSCSSSFWLKAIFVRTPQQLQERLFWRQSCTRGAAPGERTQSPADPHPAPHFTRLFIIFRGAAAGRRRQPMGGVAGLTGDGRQPMGGEGGPRWSRAAPEHDIIQFARRSLAWWGRGRDGGGAGGGAGPTPPLPIPALCGRRKVLSYNDGAIRR